LGVRLSTTAQTGPGAYPASYTVGTGSFSGGVKWRVRGVGLPPHLAPRLKKEWHYTSTPLVCLCGLLWGEHYLYLYDIFKAAVMVMNLLSTLDTDVDCFLHSFTVFQFVTI
jgi:hypothetical protein